MRRAGVWFFGRPGQVMFWIAVVAVGWFLLGPGAARARWWWPFERSGPSGVASPIGTAAAPGGWTAVAKATMPAVVNVASSKIEEGRPGSADPLFRFFFGPESGPRRERGLGSGVIVTADGYVLTNYHVVEGARDIRVTLPGQREFAAKLVGADPKTDLAVLKVSGSDFAVVRFGDSSRVEVAEVVLAIGSPFGLTQTVTMGIVSAVGRANVGSLTTRTSSRPTPPSTRATRAARS
jgi:S1-C subfamily serine protease